MDEEAGGIRQTRDIIDRKEERKMPEADIREELHRLRREHWQRWKSGTTRRRPDS